MIRRLLVTLSAAGLLAGAVLSAPLAQADPAVVVPVPVVGGHVDTGAPVCVTVWRNAVGTYYCLN